MSELKNFRSAFRGFNRQDVVNYIEYINNTHNAQVEQLNNQLQAALARPTDEEMKAKLEAAEARIAELEETLAQQDRAVLSDGASCTEQELEAYRRAERVERVAKERAEQIYAQANGVLAEATLKAESASAHIGAIADQVSNQLKEYQDSVLETKATFQEAVATLYAIKPQTEE
jgi:uncharacterized coiled-coil protein SlyX